jgi:hypothetical protein
VRTVVAVKPFTVQPAATANRAGAVWRSLLVRAIRMRRQVRCGGPGDGRAAAPSIGAMKIPNFMRRGIAICAPPVR